MDTNIKDEAINFYAGSIMFFSGIFVVLYAQRYEMGSLEMMGPGYFPIVLGAILTGIGMVMSAISIYRVKGFPSAFIFKEWRYKNLFVITGSMLAFALMLLVFGLIISTFVATMLSCAASKYNTIKRSALISLTITILVYLIFDVALNMLVPTFPTFI